MSTRRQYLLVGAVVLLVAAIDFSQRVYVGRDDALRRFETPALAAAPPERDVQAVRTQLARWLPSLGGVVDGGATDAGGWDLRLVGTFARRGQPFVVIMAAPRGTRGKPQAHRVTVGDTVAGRTVKEIRTGAVVLESASGVEELTVFRRVERPRA